MALLLCFRGEVRYSPPLCNLPFLGNEVMAFFVINTADIETEGIYGMTAMPPHPSLSISTAVAIATLDYRGEDLLRPSPKACISHHRRTLPTGPPV
ncbi:hypothetical protein PAMA_008520 [Pampus argenteus]